MRCLEQKWPVQKLQSPTMRWAASLHSLKLQRGLRGGIVVVRVWFLEEIGIGSMGADAGARANSVVCSL
jgi:hypothetical protein